MNHIVNENIYASKNIFDRHPTREASFMLEIIAFCVSVVFLLLLTAVLTISRAEPQNDFSDPAPALMTQYESL